MVISCYGLQLPPLPADGGSGGVESGFAALNTPIPPPFRGGGAAQAASLSSCEKSRMIPTSRWDSEWTWGPVSRSPWAPAWRWPSALRWATAHSSA